MENYNRKQIMDLSSFFLIEFSDDSEADLSPSIVAASVEDNNDDDDAQSSCNGSCGVGWDYSNPDHGIELYNDDGYAFQDCTARVVERPWEEFYEEEEEEGEVNMSAGRRRHNNSKASCIHDEGISRDQQPASEMEKNKNFWETCLASGF